MQARNYITIAIASLYSWLHEFSGRWQFHSGKQISSVFFLEFQVFGVRDSRVCSESFARVFSGNSQLCWGRLRLCGGETREEHFSMSCQCYYCVGCCFKGHQVQQISNMRGAQKTNDFAIPFVQIMLPNLVVLHQQHHFGVNFSGNNLRHWSAWLGRITRYF